jgi:type II secretory pathway pseudopilin PulG
MMRRRPFNRPGLSLVEAVLSIAIVGGLLASVFSVVGASAARAAYAEQASLGAWLARDLAAEIASMPCTPRANGEPEGLDLEINLLGVQLSLGGSEPAATNRLVFNDVYDYHDWTSTPPTARDGTPIAGFAGWTRKVRVIGVDPVTLQPRADTRCALITVTVLRHKKPVHTETIIRSAATDLFREPPDPDEDEGDQDTGLITGVLKGLLGG